MNVLKLLWIIERFRIFLNMSMFLISNEDTGISENIFNNKFIVQLLVSIAVAFRFFFIVT